MASLQIFALVFCSLAIFACGQTVSPEDLAGSTTVAQSVIAITLSDGIAEINSGEITASSLNLTGSLTAADAGFANLWAGDSTFSDLSALDTRSTDVSVETLTTIGNVWIDGDAMVQSSLTASMATLNHTTAMSLVVENDAVMEEILFAQTNLQVESDLNVGGNPRFFGDVFAQSDFMIENNLMVDEQIQTGELYVQTMTMTTDLQVLRRADIMNMLAIEGSVNVTGSVSVMGDISARSANIEQGLWAENLYSTENIKICTELSFGDHLMVMGGAQLSGSLYAEGYGIVDDYVKVMEDAWVGGMLMGADDLWVMGNITGEALMGDSARFDNLTVDTGSIMQVSSEFVETGNLVTKDATFSESLVSAMTTLDWLEVKSMANLSDVESELLVSMNISSETAVSATLVVPVRAWFDSVEVKGMLDVGRPSQNTAFANFDTIYSVNKTKVMNLESEYGRFMNLSGEMLTMETIYGNELTLMNLTSMMATIDMAQLVDSYIGNLTGSWAKIMDAYTMETHTMLLHAMNGNVSNVWAEDIYNMMFNTTDLMVSQTLTSEMLDTENLTNMDGTVETLRSDRGYISSLTSETGNITTLWSDMATITTLWGNMTWFDDGTFTDLYGTTGQTGNLTATAVNTYWLFGEMANISYSESAYLYGEADSMLSEVYVKDDLHVEMMSTFTNGFLAGPSVSASLTVVDEAQLSNLLVSGPSFFTDLSVKRITITDMVEAERAWFGDVEAETLVSMNDTIFEGILIVSDDVELQGDLTVEGTGEFQVGSFTRVEAAIISTTDLEAFNLNAVDGIFNELFPTDLVVTNDANIVRAIEVLPVPSDTSGSEYSFHVGFVPVSLTGTLDDGETFPVNTLGHIHTGSDTIDALVATSQDDATVATLRITGNGTLDLLDGAILFDELVVEGDIVFENEQNVAFLAPGSSSTLVLPLAGAGSFYTFDDLLDRDLGVPGAEWDPTRFGQPQGAEDLITLQGGQYKVSGTVYFMTETLSATEAVAVVVAGIDAFAGNESLGAPRWSVECVASFNIMTTSTHGSSCSFSNILVVPFGSEMTLRTEASWVFASSPVAVSVVVGDATYINVEELFERVSEGF